MAPGATLDSWVNKSARATPVGKDDIISSDKENCSSNPALKTSPAQEDDSDEDGESVAIARQVAPKKNNVTKRKRKCNDPEDDDSEPAPRKRHAKPTTKSSNIKEAKKLFNETVKAVEKRIKELDMKVKNMSGNSSAITTATYATGAGKYLSTAKKLVALDDVSGFNLVMFLADACHTDLDATIKMAGNSEDASSTVFTKLDDALLPLIDLREKPSVKTTELPEVPHRFGRDDGDVGPAKSTYGLNKQQRGQMYKQGMAWQKDRREQRRDRRAEEEDWVSVALADLVSNRNYLRRYGVVKYLPRSIAKLEELDVARS